MQKPQMELELHGGSFFENFENGISKSQKIGKKNLDVENYKIY
jgi:hypothetical protein